MITAVETWYNEKKPRRGCIVYIPGRGNTNELMRDLHRYVSLEKTMGVSIQPYKLRWYPMPKGIDDQDDSVKGLKQSVKHIETEINKIQRGHGLKRSDIALVGFSAGAVMSLNMLAHNTKDPYKAVIGLSGAILDIDAFPYCAESNSETPVLIQHNWDDKVFDWYERYEPMKECLINKNYNVNIFERFHGGHTIKVSDAVLIGEFLAPLFGYKNWNHPEVLDDHNFSQIGLINVDITIGDIMLANRESMVNSTFDDD